MSNILQYPNERREYDLGSEFSNPVFVSDLVAATQSLNSLYSALFEGLSFAIIQGMSYAAGVYQPGLFYLNGQIYYMPLAFNDGQYLNPTLIDAISKQHSDGVVRPTYTLYQAAAINSPTPGCSPQFTGNMNANRISLRTASDTIAGLVRKSTTAEVVSLLNDTAFMTGANVLSAINAKTPAIAQSAVDSYANQRQAQDIYDYIDLYSIDSNWRGSIGVNYAQNTAMVRFRGVYKVAGSATFPTAILLKPSNGATVTDYLSKFAGGLEQVEILQNRTFRLVTGTTELYGTIVYPFTTL
jgi:hypothetical protein